MFERFGTIAICYYETTLIFIIRFTKIAQLPSQINEYNKEMEVKNM